MSADQYQELMRILPRGGAFPMSSPEVAMRLGIEQRGVGSLVYHARRAGYLIGSHHKNGYFVIETAEELETTKVHILQRIEGIIKTVEALDSTWKAQQ